MQGPFHGRPRVFFHCCVRFSRRALIILLSPFHLLDEVALSLFVPLLLPAFLQPTHLLFLVRARLSRLSCLFLGIGPSAVPFYAVTGKRGGFSDMAFGRSPNRGFLAFLSVSILYTCMLLRDRGLPYRSFRVFKRSSPGLVRPLLVVLGLVLGSEAFR